MAMASVPQSRGREPQAREGHAAVSSSRQMLVWGGGGVSGVRIETSTVEIFDVISVTWRDPRQLSGQSLPDDLRGMAIIRDGDKAYSFGGWTESTRINELLEIELTSLQCRHLVPAEGSAPPPSARSSSGMVSYRRKLVTYGGFTGGEWSDELHVFDLNTNTWTAQDTTGEKPPPLAAHTLTMIDQHTALLFGGYDGSNKHNNTYLLDMETWQWSKVRTSGKKPPARSRHAACVIGDIITGHHPLVMVVGGVGDGGRTVFSDVWFLDVTNGSWSEVSLSTGITRRYGHSAVVFGTGPDFRVVVLFGGITSDFVKISKTTLLLLSQKRGLWVVDRVVGPEVLHEQDDELRVQLSRLQISTPLTDERAQQIIDKALESSSLPMRNVVAVVTGLMGSGKTWFLARLFNQKPPDLYTSTGIAEQSCRGLLHRMGNISLDSWELFSPRKVLEYLACRFHEDLPPANVAQLAEKIATLDIQADPPSTSTSSSAASPPPLPSTPASGSASVPKAGTKPPTPPTKSDTSQSMVRLVKAPQGSKSLALLELVHMIDTGGQPEFMENMPSLVYHCHLALLILNLMFDLDEYPPIHYHEKGKAYTRALPSQYSNRQIIQKLASTLQAKRFSRKESQCFRLLVVATHRDCVPRGELAARVKAFNKALERILLPANKAELIRFSAKEIAFVLNLKEPDSTDLEKLDLIRDKVSESGVGEEVEMPSSFLIFEQELVEFAKKMACSNVLSLEQCLQVGSKLKMESEVVKAALIFFHRQITLLYFRYVLPNVVFAKPQVPLDFINSIVQFSYKVASGEEKGVTDNLISSLRDGIITEETLRHEIFKKCFIADLYEAHHAIELLCHTFTLAPLSHEPQLKAGNSGVQPTPSTPIKREKREYLMMSLRPAIPDKDIPQYIPPPSEIAPLVVKFSKDCVPLSCFGSTISCLLSLYEWRLSRADNGSPECLAHNVVSLFKPQTPGQIVLVDVGHSFQIHINADRDTDRKDFPEICFQVKETIFTAIGQVFERLNLTGIEVSPAFPCPCSGEELFPWIKRKFFRLRGAVASPTEHLSHTASAYLFKNNKSFLRCSKTEKSVGTALEKHTMWLDTPVAEKEKPSLPKLYELAVPEKVGAQYAAFGTILLNDDDGSLIEAMEVDCQGKCERIVHKTLTQWIRGRGKPVTWTALIETLQHCKLTAFADHIRKKTC